MIKIILIRISIVEVVETRNVYIWNQYSVDLWILSIQIFQGFIYRGVYCIINVLHF